MYSLYIDTHFKKVNIVLLKNSEVIDQKTSIIQQQSTITMPLIIEIIKDNKITLEDISEILCVNGPGSFTGIRVGITIAKTISTIKKIPIKSTDYLEIMSVHQEPNSIVAIPDNHGAYIGKFENYKLIEEYSYYNNNDYEKLKRNNNVVENITEDYKLIYSLFQNKSILNAHLINPLYVKNVVN